MRTMTWGLPYFETEGDAKAHGATKEMLAMNQCRIGRPKGNHGGKLFLKDGQWCVRRTVKVTEF